MKKSATITLTVMNSAIVAALSACTQPAPIGVDPCAQATFNQPACEVALQQHGYHYNGGWFPMNYMYPYAYYYNSYDHYRLGGGRIYSAPSSSYAGHYVSPEGRADAFVGARTSGGRTSLSSGTMSGFASGRSGATMGRGGFGSIGAGHSGAGE
jgi:hypothetical protein